MSKEKLQSTAQEPDAAQIAEAAAPTRRELGIYGKYLTWIANAPLKPGPKSVLLALADYISNKNPIRVWPGQDKIAKKACLTPRQVRTNLNELQRLGYITIEKRERKEGYKQPHSYILKLGHTHDPADEKMSKTSDKKVSKTSGGNESNRKKMTKYVSKTSYECNKGMEPSLEINVESQDDCQPPSESRQVDNDFSNNDISGKDSNNSYALTSKDKMALRAFVWHDFVLPTLNGQELDFDGLNVSPDLIEASRLCSDYADACKNGSPSARVAFWHTCGRLFFPDAPKFADTHRLPNEENKYLNRIFDELGGRGCYVIAHIMAAWKSDPEEFCGKTNPDIYLIHNNIDAMERNWVDSMGKVDFPDGDWAADLLTTRFFPHKKQEIMSVYSVAVA